MFGILIYGFGFVLVIVAIWLIIEGIDSKDKRKVAGGAALGLGAAAGMSYYAKKRKEEKDRQRQLKA
jgi:hypothetical protein